MFDIFAPFLSKALGDVQVRDPAVASVQRWVVALVGNANNFRAVMLSGIRCACSGPAVSACLSCNRPTCLEHAYVSSAAKVMCDSCVEGRSARPSSPPPVDETKVRAAHLKTLGLSFPFTDAELHAAFRKVAAKHHPDREPVEAKKAAAQKRFVAAQQAYEWLKSRSGKESSRAEV